MKTKIANAASRLPNENRRRLSILMLLFTLRDEGTYHRALPWARYLARAGHRVDLVCVSPTSRLREHIEIIDGVRIIETPNLLDGRRSLRKLSGLSGWGPLDFLARLRLLRTNRYDIVHTFEHHPNVSLPVLLSGRGRIPCLIADGCDHYGPGGLRNTGARPRLDLVYRVLGLPLRIWADHTESSLRKRADAVTVITRALATRLETFGVPKDRITHISGSVDVPAFSGQDRAATRVAHGIAPDAHVAFFLGAARFDLDVALEAFAEVAVADRRATLVLAGPASSGLDAELMRLNLSSRVRCAGWLDEPDLGDWLACADVCLLPLRDTPADNARWPNKIGYYMAAGRPTVCSDVGEVGELVQTERIGRLAGDGPAAFAKQILWLFDHPDEAAILGHNARELAKRSFDINIQGSALETIYCRLTAQHQPAASDGVATYPLNARRITQTGYNERIIS